jgi:hypothetical protein
VLGVLHPDYLLESLTAQQWAEWNEFAALEPFGPLADDLRHGMQCAVSAAPHLKKGAKADPTVYMLGRAPERELTPQQTAAFFRAALGKGPVRDS